MLQLPQLITILAPIKIKIVVQKGEGGEYLLKQNSAAGSRCDIVLIRVMLLCFRLPAVIIYIIKSLG